MYGCVPPEKEKRPVARAETVPYYLEVRLYDDQASRRAATLALAQPRN